MKKQSHALILATLALGLCLVAAPALANDWHIINNSGEAVEVGCSQPQGGAPGSASVGTATTSKQTVNDGSTLDFTCAGTLSLQSSSALRSSSFTCASGETQTVTLTSSDDDALDLAETCAAAASTPSVGS